jgi:hypothetical protein
MSVGKMRQMSIGWRRGVTASLVPKCALHRGTPRTHALRKLGSAWWHTYCLAVSRNPPHPIHRSWTPSRPNSRNTGSPARNCRRTSAVVVAAMVCCRRHNRKPWRNSPSASTRRAASTDTRTHRRRSRLAHRLQRGCAGRRAVRSPLPAIFLPAGFFLPAVRRARPMFRSSVNQPDHPLTTSPIQTATVALIAGWQT